MATFHRTQYKIAELLRLYERDELVLQPKFQRRLAWKKWPGRTLLIQSFVLFPCRKFTFEE